MESIRLIEKKMCALISSYWRLEMAVLKCVCCFKSQEWKIQCGLGMDARSFSVYALKIPWGGTPTRPRPHTLKDKSACGAEAQFPTLVKTIHPSCIVA